MEGAWDAMGQEGWVGAHLRGATSFFSTGAADATTREARRGAVTRAGALRLTSDATTDILIGRTVLTRGRAGACRGFGATRREHVAVQELLVEVVRAVGADVGETTLATVSLRGVKPRACAWTTSAIGRLHTCSMGKVEVYDSKTRPNTADTEIPRASTRPALKLPTCPPAPHSTSVESSKYRPQTWIRTGTKVRLTHTRVTIRPPDRESARIDFSRAPASSPSAARGEVSVSCHEGRAFGSTAASVPHRHRSLTARGSDLSAHLSSHSQSYSPRRGPAAA